MKSERRGRDAGPNVVGVSANFHDASCCVLRGGVLVAAAAEERFTRIKHDPSMPRRALSYCLSAAGLTIADIDCIAFYENPVKKLGRQIWMGLLTSPAHDDPAAFDVHRPERQIREQLGYEGPIEFVDHHLSHAASSFLYSGFADAAIMTFDGVGEWATTTYGRARGTEIDLFEEVHFPNSLGLLYSTITSYLGFEVNDGEYKVMGLAPYGKPAYADQVARLIENGERGQYRLNHDYFDFRNTERMYTDALPALFGRPPRRRESALEPFHQDVARSLQVVLEDVLLRKARYLREEVGSKNLCLAGGVALNCVANGKILRSGLFDRMFVPPGADDAGGALGAAAIAHTRLSGCPLDAASAPLPHAYLGPSYSSSAVERLLRATGAELDDFRGDEGGLLAATADRLSKGKVIGWFQGKMEFGPRALGARSILADPRGPEMRDRINALVKKREAFRPFAPAVLLDRTQEHFDLDRPSPFMLLVCDVKSSLSLPAITHVDGSARVQTVDPAESARFARLLEHFARLTGCPMLLNTSFNMRGEPIVCDPTDALFCFVRSKLDALVIEDFILDRDKLPAAIPALLEELAPGGRTGVTDRVYTFW